MNLYALFLAIVSIESGGNSNAVGDHGKAVGPAQIWAVVVKDCNANSRAHFTLDDRVSLQKSFEMFQIYTQHYGKKFGKLTPEIAARIWNGGPDGPNKTATLKYWKKVELAYYKQIANEQN